MTWNSNNISVPHLLAKILSMCMVSKIDDTQFQQLWVVLQRHVLKYIHSSSNTCKPYCMFLIYSTSSIWWPCRIRVVTVSSGHMQLF